jgi:Ca2+-transporting ATPase
MEKEIYWHSLSWDEAVKKLKTDPENGLSEKEAATRRRKFGRNLLPEEKSLPKTRLFLRQFKTPLIYILLIAGLIVLFFREFVDAAVIFIAVILNTIVGYFQKVKSNEALKKLKKVIKIRAKVVREGKFKIIDSAELVNGDIFILNPGDKVPADGRIIKSYDLKINEMVLTGEWLASDKKKEPLPKETSLANRDNMVYMGTAVENGSARAAVVATGSETEIGKIARMVGEAKEEKTPLQKKLSRFSQIIGGVIIVICFFVFLGGVISGRNFLEIFTVSIAIAIAAIPEGLPVALTVILALGMQRILRKRGLVRKLSSAETLGNTSIIATDKTATLTEGKMRVAEIVAEDEEERYLTLKIAALTNEAFIENPDEVMEKWIIRGRPTDRALLLAAREGGIDKKELEKEIFEVFKIPFNSADKYLIKVFSSTNEKKNILYAAGAPEKILEMSKYLKKKGEKRLLNALCKEKIKREIENLTGKGLRVVAFAEKEIRKFKKPIGNLSFVGLIALKDPLRKGAKEAIELCRRAGVKPIIVTGDHKLTAVAVAEELGFLIKKDEIVEGKDLDKISDEELAKKVGAIQIYARVEPKHKLRIIQAWQNKGEVIAMTGDGVNDAPALKKADIGIALGSGTEVAKEVSDLVLLNDNFNIIIAAIEEGRAIIDNIRKVITYLLSDSFSETILVGASIFFGFPLPVTAVQILWVNLIEDGLPNIALAFEPKEKDLMSRKPGGHKSPLLTKEMKVLIVIIGLLTDLFLLGLFFWLYKYSNYAIGHIRTIVFAGLAVNSLFYVFSCKSLRKNVWNINPFSNKLLSLAWIFGAIMLLAAIYFPPLQIILKTYSLNIFDWGLILGLGLINIILIEAAKWYFIAKSKTN